MSYNAHEGPSKTRRNCFYSAPGLSAAVLIFRLFCFTGRNLSNPWKTVKLMPENKERSLEHFK
jgi:hypothetical protein